MEAKMNEEEELSFISVIKLIRISVAIKEAGIFLGN